VVDRQAPRRRSAADATSHHWDGDLTEYNKPLPRWWINLFWLTIAFSLAYLAWYPGLGNLPGARNWSSQAEHAPSRRRPSETRARPSPATCSSRST
jgi:cytochrome c oxidase cbb3-type subunit 3